MPCGLGRVSRLSMRKFFGSVQKQQREADLSKAAIPHDYSNVKVDSCNNGRSPLKLIRNYIISAVLAISIMC